MPVGAAMLMVTTQSEVGRLHNAEANGEWFARMFIAHKIGAVKVTLKLWETNA